MNTELANINKCFGANKLNVIIKETNCVFLHSRYKFRAYNKLLLMHDTDEIIQISEFKYLGITIDGTLNFSAHINKLKSNINQCTGLLWRVRNSIPYELAK